MPETIEQPQTAALLEPLVGRQSVRDVSDLLWCELETDEERMAFLRGGGAWRTGIMAEAMVPDIVELLACRMKLANAMQWLGDYMPDALAKPSLWDAIGETGKANEAREALMDTAPYPGVPTPRQWKEWHK